MSGAVAQRANGMSKALGGRATFFYALTRVFLSWENTEVTVTARRHRAARADARRDRRERRWHGGGMMLAPGARPDDGLFDVVLIGDVGKVDFLTTAPKIYKGKSRHAPEGRGAAATRVEVTADERLPIEVEGEQPGRRRRSSRSCPARYGCASPEFPESASVLGSAALRERFVSSFATRSSSRDPDLHRLEAADALREVVDTVDQLLARCSRRSAIGWFAALPIMPSLMEASWDRLFAI